MTPQETHELFVFMLENLDAEDARREGSGLLPAHPRFQQNLREVSSVRRIVLRMLEHGGDPMVLPLLSWRYLDRPGYAQAWFDESMS